MGAPAAILLLLLALPRVAATAQIVRGRVVDADRRAPLAAVAVTATGPASARALSDSAGFFQLDLPAGGTYTISAQHIGYLLVSQPLQTVLGETIAIEIQLSPSAIPLEPLTIVGRTSRNASGLAGFYQRAEWSGRLGLGTIIRRADIERRASGRTVHLLGTHAGTMTRGDTIYFRRSTRPCRPEVFVDGARGQPGVIDVELHAVEGIELYRGPSQVPPEFSDRNGCGSIVIWTRQGEAGTRPFKWRHLAFAAGLVVGLIVLLR